MESLSNLDKILQDNRQDTMESYNILQKFYGIQINYGKDPTLFKIISNPTGSYSILENPIRSCSILWVSYRILDKRKRTLQHSVKFYTVESYKILQDLTESQTKPHKIVIIFQSKYHGILDKILNDSTVACQSCLWNPNQLWKDPTLLQTR